MSLRFKLLLSYLLIVGLVVVIGVIAFITSRGLRTQMSQLSRHSGFALDARSPLGKVLEVEGSWEGDAFVAHELEELSGPRRPKLRGPVTTVDPARRTIQMYGLDIVVDSSTEFETGGSIADLHSGQRAEVSVREGEGARWNARKIRLGDIKTSDKIKGTVTGYRSDGIWPDTLEVSGITILAGRERRPTGGPGRLRRLQLAIEAGQVARRMLTVLEGDPVGPAGPVAAAIVQDADELVRLSSGMRPTGAAEEGAERDATHELRERVELLTSRGWDIGIRERLQREIRLLLRDRIIPDMDVRLLETQDEFSDEVRDVVIETERTVRLVLAVSLGAVLIAIVLASYMWRSISRPIQSLSTAATRIGAGYLDTRVPESSRDELGVLAASFNRMAEALAASTVSIDNLNAVKEELRESLTEKELLLREVHHRVKNNLQIVSSLLDLQAGRATDPQVQALFAESKSRIRAMALVHEQFHQSSASDRINLGGYLRQLVAGLAQSLAPARGSVDVRVDATDLHLDIDRAITCGLITNELVTNAIKHVVSPRGGSVLVTIGRRRDGMLELTVSDDGPGMSTAARMGSLGLELVEALTVQLGGRVETGPGPGAEFHIVFPGQEEAATA